MTKLDWEKQNRSELVAKRLHQYLDERNLVSSKHESLLKACGFPPSIEGVNAIKISLSEWRNELKELQRRLERNSKDGDPNISDCKRFLKDELKAIYTGILVLRLLSIYPDRLSKKYSHN